MTENFIYDNLNRLTTWSKNGTLIGAIEYAANGNIDNKENIGTYEYNSEKVHAVERIDNNDIISQDEQNIAYNPFLKTASITQENNSYTITYGTDAQRKKTVLSTNNSTIFTRIYSGLYEKEISGTTTKELHYIPTPCGTVAVHLKQGSTENTNFLLKDYLGSSLKIVNSAGTTLEEHSYDPWGNHRNPSTWLLSDFTGSYRGYTGHEHLPDFQLINMNGRMYDPVIGRVLSPDNYVQDATNAQDYNRYSYARNNPLKYTDPDGEWIHIPIMAVIGGISNLVTNWKNIDGFWQGFVAFNVGAGQGALTAVCPPAGIIAGGAITGATNNLIGQTGNNFSGMNNVNWGSVAGSAGIGIVTGAVNYVTSNAVGGGLGAFLGSSASNVSGQLLNYGLQKYKNPETKFEFNWKSLLLNAVISTGSYYAFSAIGWGIDRDKLIPNHRVSFRQYVTMQADFQRSMFWGKEYGGYLLNDGSVMRMPAENRASAEIKFSPKPKNAFADYHTHWDKPGAIRLIDENFNYVDETVRNAKITVARYHGATDFGYELPSLVFNRYDASYHSGFGNNYSIINPLILRRW